MKSFILMLCLALAFTFNTTEMFAQFKKDKTVEKIEVSETKTIHPQNSKAIELVFEVDGTKFYKFKSVADLPQIRQTQAMQFLSETSQVMDNELLKNCLDNLAKSFDTKNTEEFYAQISVMKTLADGVNYTDAFYHVCSATTFTLDENINDYDPLIASESIEKFRELPSSFFLTTLSEKFPTMAMQLPKDLERHLALQKVRLNASLLALKGIGVELPMKGKSRISSFGQVATSQNIRS